MNLIHTHLENYSGRIGTVSKAPQFNQGTRGVHDAIISRVSAILSIIADIIDGIIAGFKICAILSAIPTIPAISHIEQPQI